MDEIASQMSDLKNNLLLVSGPTASGKSSLSIKLAHSLKGEVVNIDSVQVYKGFDIGSAKMSNEEMEGVPHHLIDYVDPRQGFNGREFIEEAARLLPGIQQRGYLPILTGGTSLYITLLFHGLADLPGSNTELRDQLDSMSDNELHDMLERIDSQKADSIHPHDRFRVIRAIESNLGAARKSSEALAKHNFSESPFTGIFLVLIWPRDLLYGRIEKRTELMIEGGLVGEVQKLIATYGTDLQGFSALGYSQIIDYIEGQCTLAEATGTISKLTRNFAKRQMTYWRNEPAKRGWEVFPKEHDSTIQIGDEQNLNGYKRGRRNDKNLKAFRVYNWSYPELVAQLRRALGIKLNQNQVWFVNGEKLTNTIG